MVRFIDADRLDTAGKLGEYSSGATAHGPAAGKLRTTVVGFAETAGDAGRRFLGAVTESADDRSDDAGATGEGFVLNGVRAAAPRTVRAARKARGAKQGGNAGSGGSGTAAAKNGEAAACDARVAGRKAVRSGPPSAGKSVASGPAGNATRAVRPASPTARFAKGGGKRAARGRKAVKTTKKAAGNVARAVQTMAAAARGTVTSMAAAVGSAVGVPVLLVIAGVVSVAAILAALLSWLPGFHAQQGCSGERTEIAMPEGARPWVEKAAETSGLPQDYIAAMMTIESGFTPDIYADDVNGGTWGLLQLNRSVWRGVHPDGADETPPEGITDPMVHAEYGGIYLKKRLDGVRKLKADHPNDAFSTLDDLDALVIAHNAGEGGLMDWPDIPEVTRTYLDKMHAMTGGGSGAGCSTTGTVVGSLEPPLVMNGDGTAADVDAMDLPSVPSYERWQCTWWTASRRAHIGRPVDAYMGHGYMWKASADTFGYPIDKSPRPGDVMVFQRGVLDSSATYGHVAVVEEVRDDGSIVISESGASIARVVLRVITSQQLEANRDGVDFIH